MRENGLDITLTDILRVVDRESPEFVLYSWGNPKTVVFELATCFLAVHPGDDAYDQACELALEWRLMVDGG